MNRAERWGIIRMTEQVNRIEDMIKVFEPFPLMEKEEFRQFYVKTYGARGADAVKYMAYGLRLSSNAAMKILFMGHRGSGKSTELFLLKQEIENEFDVINFFIQEEVDVDSMTYTDFIFAIMSQIVKYVEIRKELYKVLKDDIESLYKYWEEERIIESVEYEDEALETGFEAKLSFLSPLFSWSSAPHHARE